MLVFAQLVQLATVPDAAVLGACLGLAAAVFLFIFYIHPDASDLAPHRTSAATPSTKICATSSSNTAQGSTPKAITSL